MENSFKKVLEQLELHTIDPNIEDLTKAFEELKEGISDSQEHIFSENPILLCNVLQSMVDFKNKDIYYDRFFLEEMLFRLIKNDNHYVRVLLRDWLQEIVLKTPMDEKTRFQKMQKQGQKHYYLDSEKTLEYVLKNLELPEDFSEESDYYLFDSFTETKESFSIQDISTQSSE